MKFNPTLRGWRKIVDLAVVVLALWVASASAQMATQTYRLHVDGLACPFCAYGIEKQLSRIDGVETIDIDIGAGSITLTATDGKTLDESTARRAVEAAGFSLRDFERIQQAP